MKKTTLTLAAVIILLITGIAVSCKYINPEPLGNFLEKLSTEVRIAEAVFPDDVLYDNEKVASLSSGEEKTVKFLLQNPEGLTVHPVITVGSTPDDIALITGLEKPYTYSVSADNSVVSLTYTNPVLLLMEMGRDITPYITLTVEGYENTVPQYSIPIRSNSAPLMVQGACLMVDTSSKLKGDNSEGSYVLCFNLPDDFFALSGIHADVKTLTITGFTDPKLAYYWETGADLNIDYENRTIPQDAENHLYTACPDSMTLQKITYTNISQNDGLASVTFAPTKHPVYIPDLNSTVPKKGESKEYTITVTDTKGLSSTVVLKSDYKQLEPVQIMRNGVTLENGILNKGLEISADNYSYFIAQLIAPDKAVGTVTSTVDNVEVVYSLQAAKLAAPIKDYSETGHRLHQKRLELATDYEYLITAYAHKDGYLDSVVSYWDFIVGNWERAEDIEIVTIGSIDFVFELSPANYTLDPESQIRRMDGNAVLYRNKWQENHTIRVNAYARINRTDINENGETIQLSPTIITSEDFDTFENTNIINPEMDKNVKCQIIFKEQLNKAEPWFPNENDDQYWNADCWSLVLPDYPLPAGVYDLFIKCRFMETDYSTNRKLYILER